MNLIALSAYQSICPFCKAASASGSGLVDIGVMLYLFIVFDLNGHSVVLGHGSYFAAQTYHCVLTYLVLTGRKTPINQSFHSAHVSVGNSV